VGARRVVALVILVIWAVLLVVGLVGGSVPWLPHTVTTTAGLVALISAWLFVPAGTLYGFALELRRGAIRNQGSDALAIRWRWRWAIGGGWSLILGLGALFTTTITTLPIRVFGVVMFVWGVLAIAVAVLAFRMKRLASTGRVRG
jgi:hypothetical protein